jgi:hypothetical protein
MADDSREEIIGLRFREDILRGVRLFAIVFAAILVCVAAYQALRTPADVQGAAPGAIPEAVQPSPEPSPDAGSVSATDSEVHPLIVPEPPPVAETAVKSRVARPKDPGVPPPPPATPTVVRARRAPAPSGREFETSAPVALPVAPVEESSEAKPLTPKQAVGYKSLIEANANRAPVEPTPASPAAPAEDSSDKAAKGNRFFKAVGKIFHPSGKKDAEPSTLQPKQQ